MNDISASVSQNLELDVMRILDEFLDVNPRIPKSFFGLRARGVIPLDQRDIVMSHPHPPPTATRDRFDHDRIPDLFRSGQSFLFVFDVSIRTRRSWHPGLLG